MGKKELLKQLIAGFQALLPIEVYPRELTLPLDSGKIITVPGVRRCGKSSLFLLTINQLIRERIIAKEQILFLNFDDERLHLNADNLDEILQAYRELYPAIPLKDVYMFFDEVQMADDWQPFVRRVYEQECRHIFLTGSNSRMLSSELATSLRGRTLQYEEFPLSFNEFCNFTDINTNYYVPENRAKLVNAFKTYLHGGGFPEVVLAAPLYKDRILQEYFFVMLYKDLVERYEIKNPEPIRYFIKRVMSNLAKPTSINRIYNELKSQGVSIGKNTLYDVIVQTESVYLFFSLTKYEPSLVKESTGDKKYYCIDNGLRSVLLNPHSEDNGKLLENAVFLHLRRNLRIQEELHYYKGKKECDFVVVEYDKVTRLIQVSYQMGDEETRKREFDRIEQRYNSLKAMVGEVQRRPMVFSGELRGGVWYAVGGKSFLAQLFHDAGADYFLKDDPRSGGVTLDFETVYNQAESADYWRIANSFAGEYCYDALKAQDERYADFKAFKEKHVIYCNMRQKPFYESMPAEPEIVLADMIKVFHPEILPDYEPVYYDILKK